MTTRVVLVLLLATHYGRLNGNIKHFVKDVYQPYGFGMCQELCNNSSDSYIYTTEKLCCLRIQANGSCKIKIRSIDDSPVLIKEHGKEKGDDSLVANPRSISSVTDSNVVPNGYNKLEKYGSYVKAYDVFKTWEEALQICQSEGATLVKLDSPKKGKFCLERVSSYRIKKECIWIGLHDRYANDTWFWADGSQLGHFKAWFFREPNHYHKGLDENYVFMKNKFLCLKWFDTNGNTTCPFICEMIKSN